MTSRRKRRPKDGDTMRDHYSSGHLSKNNTWETTGPRVRPGSLLIVTVMLGWCVTKKIAKIGENQPSLFNGQAVVYRQILFTARFWRKLKFGGKCKMAVNLRLKGRAKKTKRKI